MTNRFKCVSTAELPLTSCCPQECAQKRLTSVETVDLCLASMPQSCQLQMRATASFTQTPCFAPISPTRSSIQPPAAAPLTLPDLKRATAALARHSLSGEKSVGIQEEVEAFSIWVELPRDIVTSYIPWSDIRLELDGPADGNEDSALRGCHVVLAGLGVSGVSQCEPLPASRLFDTHLTTLNLGNLTPLLAQTSGAFDAVNLIVQPWAFGEQNRMESITTTRDGKTERMYRGDWSPKCAPLGRQLVRASAFAAVFGRKTTSSNQPAEPPLTVIPSSVRRNILP